MKAVLIGIGILIVIFFAIGFSESNTPEGKERSRQRAAIDLCWKDQQRRSNDPGTARFIAGACEKMEADFKAKWGVNP